MEKAFPQYGVVLFDNVRDMAAGWACLSGGAPFRISGVHDLAQHNVWVTNLIVDEYRARARRMTHLRQVDFLRSALSAIGSDLGMRIDGSNAEEAAPVLAGVIQRAVELAAKCYSWGEPASDLRGDVLVEDIARGMPTRVPPEEMRTALLGAYQSYSRPEWDNDYQDGVVYVTLRLNRLDYARSVLSTMVPDDAWTYIPPAQAASLTIAELLDPESPTLVEAAVEFGGADPSLSILTAYGQQVSKRTALRRWISQPELLWLSRYARIRVTSVLRSRSAVPISQKERLPDLLVEDPLMRLSLGAGLVAESHWSALARQVYQWKDKSSSVTSLAVWLRATDRALCFALALKAHQAGFRVQGYGTGAILLRVPRVQLSQLRDLAEQWGCAHPCFDPIFKEHGIG